MDADRRMTTSYAMNKMASAPLGNENTEAYVREIYALVDRMQKSSSLRCASMVDANSPGYLQIFGLSV